VAIKKYFLRGENRFAWRASAPIITEASSVSTEFRPQQLEFVAVAPGKIYIGDAPQKSLEK
jgi:hypothetical protein